MQEEGPSSSGAVFKVPDRVLDMVAEVSGRLSETPVSQLTRRFYFLCYALQSRPAESFSFQDISQFLFEEQGFKAADDQLCDLKELFLPEVLRSKVGIPMVLGFVYKGVAKRVGKSICFIRSPDLSILRCKEKDETHFVDLARNGKILDRTEMLELLQTRFKGSENLVFDPLEDDDVIGIYLSRLCREYAHRQDDKSALTVYEYLISLQPKNLSLLRDRSMT